MFTYSPIRSVLKRLRKWFTPCCICTLLSISLASVLSHQLLLLHDRLEVLTLKPSSSQLFTLIPIHTYQWTIFPSLLQSVSSWLPVSTRFIITANSAHMFTKGVGIVSLKPGSQQFINKRERAQGWANDREISFLLELRAKVNVLYAHYAAECATMHKM